MPKFETVLVLDDDGSAADRRLLVVNDGVARVLVDDDSGRVWCPRCLELLEVAVAMFAGNGHAMVLPAALTAGVVPRVVGSSAPPRDQRGPWAARF